MWAVRWPTLCHDGCMISPGYLRPIVFACFIFFSGVFAQSSNTQTKNTNNQSANGPVEASLTSIQFGVRASVIITPANPTSLGLGANAEYQFAPQGLALRLSAAYPLQIALDALYRLNEKNSEGPLYLGLGFGFTNVLEGRAVVGYEWPLTKQLRAMFEGVACTPIANWQPRLELVLGINFRP